MIYISTNVFNKIRLKLCKTIDWLCSYTVKHERFHKRVNIIIFTEFSYFFLSVRNILKIQIIFFHYKESFVEWKDSSWSLRCQ